MLSEADLARLEAYKLDRFRQSFGEALTQVVLCITLDNCLLIPCQSDEQVQLLLQEEAALKHFGWLLLGVDRVAVYLEQQLVWEGCTRELQVVLVDSPLRLESNDSRGDAMVTATLEPKTEERQLEVEMPAQPLRTVDELAVELATITGRSFEAMRQEILTLNPATYQFREYQLISPAVADQTIDRWSQQLKARLRSATPAIDTQSNGATPMTATQPAATVKPDRKPAAKKTTTKTAAKKPATRKPAAEPAE